MLLALVLLAALLAWLQIFRTLESGPQAVQHAQQLASLVNLGRASLRYSDPIARFWLIKTLADEEGLDIVPRQTSDDVRLLAPRRSDAGVVQTLRQRLGQDTVLAESVNGRPGFWVGFSIESDAYWLRADDTRLQPSRRSTWLTWLGAAGLLSLLGAALIASIVTRPLRQLSLATQRVGRGQYEACGLDESVGPREIRALNMGFNRMARQLSKVEHDRAIMLAGLSHDLRTPLARLRLDTEMSVHDDKARAHMVDDIEQLDAIIDKFLDYARLQQPRLSHVALQPLIERALFAFADDPHMRCELVLEPALSVLADPVELLRVLSNLLENARRYGRSADGVAHVELRASASRAWVLLTVSDRGPGVAPELLHELTRPFFRADESRGKSTGAGLGLAIVEASVLRMGGGFSLGAAESGGLGAHIRLQRA